MTLAVPSASPSRKGGKEGRKVSVTVYLPHGMEECVCMHRVQLQYIVVIVIGALLILMSGQGHADRWYAEQGEATWYGKRFDGRKTASGDRFSEQEMTAAHRTLPLGTKVMVENQQTGEQTEVKITDRGPYAQPGRRIIDLSRAAANSIGIVHHGKRPVRVMVTEKAAHPKQSEEVFYEVQAGAFEDSAQAHKVLDLVRERFPAAYIAPRAGPSGEYYRVRVGPFATEEETKKVAKALQRQGHRIFLDEIPASAAPMQAPGPATGKAIEAQKK
jgi:rare lipoprotein A